MKFCSNCGKKINREVEFCPNCGLKKEKVKNNEPIKKDFNVKILESMVNIIVIIFFSLVVLVLLFSFSNASFFGLILVITGIIIYFKFKIPTLAKIIALFLIFFAVGLIISSDNEKTNLELKNNTFKENISLENNNNNNIWNTKLIQKYNIASELKEKVISTLPNIKIIEFNIENYNKQDNQYIIDITYYFEEQWLVDNYLGFLGDATKIYKAIFTNNNQVMQVQITAKEKYKDNYGNIQERFLAKSLMTKLTANQINWNGFESSNLDTITPMEFYGKSTYKDLKDLEDNLRDLQNNLQSWQTTIPSYYGSDLENLEK